MAERVVYLNGQYVAERDAKVSVLDRGFRWGDAVYDATRTFEGRLFKLHERSRSAGRTSPASACSPRSSSPRKLGVPTDEGVFTMFDLYQAEEAMLTASTYCLVPVVKVNGLALGEGTPGPIVGRLLQAWSELVGMDIVAQAARHAG